MSRGADAADRLARLRDAMSAGTIVAEEEVAFLRRCLAHSSKNLQRAAAECLAELAGTEPQRKGTLSDALDSFDSRARWGAAYAFSVLGEFPAAAIDTAVELLGTQDRDLRWAAADLLKRAVQGGESTAMKRLCNAAATGTFLQRRMALYALRDLAIGDPDALVAALDALNERDVELRLAGLAALVRLSESSARAADRIVVLLGDSEPRVQRAAAAALGPLGFRSEGVFRAIERALASGDESVRRAAKKSLDRLRDP